MKHSHLLYLIFLPLFLFLTANLYAAEKFPAMLSATVAPQFSIKPYPEEGFAAGTLVRTLDGFKPIEDIHEQDTVYGEFLEPKRVLKTAKRVVQKHVCLKIQYDTFYTGCDQVVRTSYEPMWQRVDTLQKRELLLDVLVNFRQIDEYELISKSTVLYQLEVEDHTFCIGSAGIVVHNADIATVGTAMLFLEYVAHTNPVIAVVGSTLGLAEVAYWAYKEYQRQVKEKSKNTHADESESEKKSSTQLFLAERFYYEQRKQDLIKLRNEVAEIYCGIVAIKELFHPLITTFSSQFLQHTVQQRAPSNALKISIADELKLSDNHKTALRKAREQEFALLEKEIGELHALLVVHFNELVRHVNEARNVYDKALPTINHAINIWNANLNSITDSIASSAYEQGILEECLLNTIKQATAELKVIVTYYQHNKQLTCLKQSTDIIERLDALNQVIIENEQ